MVRSLKWFCGAAVLAVIGCAVPPSDGVSRGPHCGLLVPWGAAEYQAEFVVDHERQEAIVYVLKGTDGASAAIPTRRVWLNLRRPSTRVALDARPLEGDPPGAASRFVGKMPMPTRGRKFAGTLSATVAGQSWSGEVDQQRDYVLRTR